MRRNQPITPKQGNVTADSRTAPTQSRKSGKPFSPEHIRSSYGDVKTADLTLKFNNGTDLMVHKIVVYRLPFFEGACRNDFEEAEEDVIYFPDDPANAMRLLVMSLYGFTLAESIQEVYGAANASYNNVPVLAQTFDLSHKYLVPGLDRTILEYLQICYNDSSADIAFAKDGWFWRLAEYLYEDHDRAPGIRICLPIMLGKHVCLRGDLDDVSQQELRKFPELTIQLAQLTIRAVTYARGNNKLVDERTTASSQGGPGGGVPSRQGGP